MSASLQAAQIIRCINAGVSCLASTFIVFMILTKPEKGLASPYSRIIFGMSVSDILFSLGLFLSPFMSPTGNPDALFAMGTTESCEGIGFLFLLGVQCLLFYTVFLTYYFMRRIKYKVTPQNFAKKEERYFHCAFIVLSLGVAVTAAATGSINPQAHGSLCGLGSYPENCVHSDELVCERGGESSSRILVLYSGIFGAISFLALIGILALCTHHVYRVESKLTIPAREIGDRSSLRVRRVIIQEEQPNEAVAANRRHQRRLILTKQAFNQSVLYILTFFIVYLAPMIGIFQVQVANILEEPEWRFWLSSVITPLGGIFNILIYTRPKVLKLRERYPDVIWIRLFVAIVLAGGEVPSIADLRTQIPARNESNHPPRNQAEANNADVDQQPQYDLHHAEVNGNVQHASSNVGMNDLGIIDSQNESNELSYDIDVSAASDLLSFMEESRYGYFSVFERRAPHRR